MTNRNFPNHWISTLEHSVYLGSDDKHDYYICNDSYPSAIFVHGAEDSHYGSMILTELDPKSTIWQETPAFVKSQLLALHYVNKTNIK